MIDILSCHRYSLPMPKLSKVNSFIIDDRVIYVTKSDYLGKTSRLYIAYDYETKIQLAFNINKDELIEYLKDKNLKVLKNVK